VNEASKTLSFRGLDFVDRYLRGKVLDIGCGTDLVVPAAQPFDLAHGDANRIADYLPIETFDCVHSSHCLEHMQDVPKAIRQWWSLVKPGGVMIITVPEENLYEQGIWPSVFNPDHKATFRFDTQTSWSPVSYDLRTLVRELPGAEVLEAQVQDVGYEHRLKHPWRHNGMGLFGRLAHFFGRARKAVLRPTGDRFRSLDAFLDKLEWHLGKPVDQTLGGALAQIQVVVRKAGVSAQNA
jgi:SAM-dependent methyltransferase